MRIKSVTVQFEVRDGKDEQENIQAFIRSLGGIKADREDAREVPQKVGGAAEYIPGSPRAALAYEALATCKRVKVLSPQVLESWAAAYPHVDLAQEIAKCEAWAESKDVRRTPRGWQKSLYSWLSKAQDNTRGSTQAAPAGLPVDSTALAKLKADTEGWQ